MKLGFGLYRHQLNQDSYRFARQCGATHLVVHLVDYTNACRPRQEGPREANQQPVGRQDGWGRAGDPNDPCWSVEWLERLRADVEAEGLSIWAIENLDPSMWHDVLLDGPRKDEQMALLSQVVRNVGRAPVRIAECSLEKPVGVDWKVQSAAGITLVADMVTVALIDPGIESQQGSIRLAFAVHQLRVGLNDRLEPARFDLKSRIRYARLHLNPFWGGMFPAHRPE